MSKKRKMSNCSCDNCGIEFLKPVSEINRNLKLNRRNFCGRKCSGISNIKNFGDRKNNYDISKHSNNTKDEFSPFRYHLRNCKRRGFNLDIDLTYLKEIWDKQKGICPFSGVNLILNAYTKDFKDQRFSASIDRIDSNKGYIKGNVRWVSRAVNHLKNDMTDEHLIQFLEMISEKFKK